MPAETHRALCELAGRHLDGEILGPYLVGVESPPARRRGVYVVFDPLGECVYVGKAFSMLDSQRVRDRIREHVRDLVKREAFAELYLLPLKDGTPRRQVEVVEGWVARHMRPYLGSAHPNPFRRPR